MKWNLMKLNTTLCLLLLQMQAYALTGNFFNVSATGTPAIVNITLCLNAKGPLSCQSYNITALSLSISTVVANHTYPAAGIKINTPNYTLGSGCTPLANGFCSFSVSNTKPATIIVNTINWTSWTEYSADPVFTPVPSGGYYPSVVYSTFGQSSPFYKMWYEIGTGGGIGLAYSNDGISWSPPINIRAAWKRCTSGCCL